MASRIAFGALLLFIAGCTGAPPPPDKSVDAGVPDAGTLPDAEDAGVEDAGPPACTFEPPTACPAPEPHYADVEPIFVDRCQVCHSPAGGEWPLLTYQHVADWAPDIHDLVLNCSMPPPDAGVPITDEERVDILTWLLCGLPE